MTRRRTWAIGGLGMAAVAALVATGSVITSGDGNDDETAATTEAAESNGSTESDDATGMPGDTTTEPDTTAAASSVESAEDGSTDDPETAPVSDDADTFALAGSFLDSFDGDPARPEPFVSADWDLTVHSRSVDTLDELEPVQAGHGPDCGAPPATHEATAYDSVVYRCRNHMMTALNATDYGMIYLTPDHLVDFSQGPATVAVDVSTARTSARDWWDIWISPYDDHLQLPLDIGSDVDVAGPPKRAVHVFLGTENQIQAEVIEDFQPIEFPDWPEDYVTGDPFTGYETFLEPDFKRRDRFEIIISKNHLKVGMPAYDFWWIDTDIPELDWGTGVVQFGHHSYNPTKDCNFANNPVPPVDACVANTWHWDNAQIDPAIPFTIVGSSQRSAVDGRDTVELDRPAPADAHLRFAALGSELEVSFDGGPWVAAATPDTAVPTPQEHFTGYWQPIPEGTTSVSFRGVDWYGSPWHVRDVSVWSLQT